MTVQEFKPSQGEHEQLDPLPWPPSRKSAWVVKQRRPRKSASSLESPLKAESSRSVFPPSAHDNGIKHDNQKYEGFDLGQTRPRASPRAKVLESSCEQLIDIISSGRKSVKFGKSSSDGTGACDDGVSDDHGPKGAKLSRAAKLMEEDRRRIASIRSFLQNFLEGRDCSIKKRLDLNVHQTETGRSVTDAVVQEVCKLRPDMIGLSLRVCTQVTDVGLWCVARHTRALRELNLSGCHGVTTIGLRSLAICCDKIEHLDFEGCTRLNDLGLRVIGGGCWDLRALSLEGCAQVSDSGVAEVAKTCTGLTYLNISNCERVGEHGDRALIQLGRSCHQLRGLDAFGCSHAQDPGLLAVARGCPKLEKLMLTGCGGITGKSVRALARGCPALRQLSLSGCDGVGNRDLREIAKGCTELRHLNIAQCKKVDANGLAALARGLKNLTELDVGGCVRVDDASLRSLCDMNAHFLNLSGCEAISEAGVASIAMNCTALSSLNVTGCPSIRKRFMTELCSGMKLSEPARAFFGFQPRENAKELLALAEEQSRRVSAVVTLQARMRGCLARGRANVVRSLPRPRQESTNLSTSLVNSLLRNWIVKTRLARAQAYVRGYFTRKWYCSRRAQVREHRSAVAIQASWRMLVGRRAAERLKKEMLTRETSQGLATRIQAVWWGYRGRVRMREVRAREARRLLLEAREQARRELCSITIQSNWRRVSAQKELNNLRRLRDTALGEGTRREAAAVLIQSVARVQRGRAVLSELRERRYRELLEWEMGLRLQAAWRGRRGRVRAHVLRILREREGQHVAAKTIQCFWRAARAKHLTKIQRGLSQIRQMKGGAAKDIQRVYHGFKGRLRAKACRSVFDSDHARELAALVIQRIFRGHKGRERFECKLHLRELEDKARPLQLKLDELSTKAVTLSERLRRTMKLAAPLRDEQTMLREELFHIRHTKDKYTDTDKINGCRQRFITKFLQVRLEELLAVSEKKLELIDAEYLELEEKKRRNDRLLRETERELIPLGVGTVQKVKLMRTARLRQKVRTEKRASTTIQRVFRGWRVRKAVHSWYRGYWIESQDEATGDVFYVNTWSQEARWAKPLEMSLFEDTSLRSPSLEDSFNDEVGDPESTSARFSRRLRQLTEEASHAAEEEASLLQRLAAAARGEGIISAAQEWTFVSIDRSQLPPAKCWYRRSTSEYFWGDDPTLHPTARNPSSVRRNAAVESGGRTGAGGGPAVAERGGSGGSLSGGGDPARGFLDRAAGEAWLKSQDLDALLGRSETVRDIGPFGWRQVRSFLPCDHEDEEIHSHHRGQTAACAKGGSAVLSSRTTAAATAGGGVSTPGGVNASGNQRDPRQGGLEVVVQGRPIEAAVVVGSEATTSGATTTPLFTLTFFHNAELGEARWCLSPRTALKTPRTPP